MITVEREANIEQIAEDLYRIEIPLPSDLLLGSINSYVVKGNGRSLIIDTGMIGTSAGSDAGEPGKSGD